MHMAPLLARAGQPLKLVAFGSILSLAQSAAAQAEQDSLPSVTVRSTFSQSLLEQTPASVTVIDGERARDRQWQVNLSDALPGVPGLLIQNRQNYAQDAQLSIRGHGARSTFGVRGVQIFVDGIPSTMPDGQGHINHIDLASTERIEVLRGPYSALYGNASGGVINVYTERGEGPPQVLSSFAVGSNGQRRLGLKARGESGGFGYAVSANRYHTDGWRRHSDADKDLLNARLDTKIGDDGDLTLVASHVSIEAKDPSGLTPKEWQADPRAVAQGPLDFNTRKSTQQTQWGLTYERRIDAVNALRFMVYAGERKIVQYQSIPVAAQQAPTSAGGVIDLARSYAGMDVRWANRTELAYRPLSVSVGLSVNTVEEDRLGYNNFTDNQFGVKGNLRRNERNKLTNIDPYAQASWAFAPDWTAEAGLRWSNVLLKSHDHYISPGNLDDSGQTGFHRLLPVLSLQYRVNANAQVFASIGSGLETPTFNEISYRTAGRPGLNFGLQPATSTSAEIGWRQRIPGDGWRGEWTVALFQTRTRHEIVAAENAGGRTSYQNAGRTRRQGLELSGNAWLTPQLQINGAYTWLDARLNEGFCDPKGVCVPSGHRIAGTARHHAWLAAEWRPISGWRLGLDWRHVGSVAANDTNSVMAPSYGVVGASAGYTQSWGPWKLNAYARIDNLANKRYVGSVIVNESNGRYYESAPGRQWMMGMNLSYQF